VKKVIVHIALDDYPVIIGNNLFESLAQLINEYYLPKRIFVVVDRNVDKLYGSSVKKMINGIAVKKHFLDLPASEKIKSFKTVIQIFTRLYEEKFGRDTLLISIGGGTVGDAAGFAASTYMRGIPLLHVPTTLLSAVDSSIGGKTGINFNEAKNLIGTFYQPSLVLIDTNFLKSLPEEELISGFSEVIKYSYLTDGGLYSTLLSDYKLLLKKDLKFLDEIIYESVKIKSAVVSKDEYEKSGLRKILNFGHTFAHAFESDSDYKLSHGKAVIAGIISSLMLSHELGLMSKNQLDYMIEVPLKFKSHLRLNDFDGKKVFRLMGYDKKNRDGEIKFVLVKNFGELLVDVSVEPKLVINAIKKTKKILV
jgi:3-dehydroquinate synthase